MGGVNEALTVMLMAAKFGVSVLSPRGRRGLCEYVQHLSLIDYIAISGSLEKRCPRVRGSPPRAFRGPGAHPRCTLRRADGGRLQHRHEAGIVDAFEFPSGREWAR
jgi:L-fuconate dehydratase